MIERKNKLIFIVFIKVIIKSVGGFCSCLCYQNNLKKWALMILILKLQKETSSRVFQSPLFSLFLIFFSVVCDFLSYFRYAAAVLIDWIYQKLLNVQDDLQYSECRRPLLIQYLNAKFAITMHIGMIFPCLKQAFRRTIRVIVWKSNMDEEVPARVWSFGRAFHHQTPREFVSDGLFYNTARDRVFLDGLELLLDPSFSLSHLCLCFCYDYIVMKKVIGNIDHHFSEDIRLHVFEHHVNVIIVLIVFSSLEFVISLHCLFLQLYPLFGRITPIFLAIDQTLHG